MAAYNVSKAGVMSLSETLAAELNGTGIAVTVLCPTFVKTNVFTDGRITPASMNLSQQLARWTGLSADNVAARTLDAHDGGRLYVVPQLDATVIWHLKRHFPASTYAAPGCSAASSPPTTERTGNHGDESRRHAAEDQGQAVGTGRYRLGRTGSRTDRTRAVGQAQAVHDRSDVDRERRRPGLRGPGQEGPPDPRR